MSYYILFAHLEIVLVKKGDILNGKHNVGVIGSSGNAVGKHLHLQVETGIPSSGDKIRGFDKYASPTNPSVVINEYGKMCQNTPTQSYWNYDTSLNSPYICNGHHAGIDYSGVIDNDFESKYAYTPSNGRAKVIEVGNDVYKGGNSWGGYGNYVIIEILGHKKEEEDEPMKKEYSYNIAPLYKLDKPPRYGDKLKAKFKESTILWLMDKNGKLVKTDIKVKAGDELNVTREMKYTHPSDGSKYRYASFASDENPKRYYVRVHKY